MSSYSSVQALWAQVALNRHGVIEAHAGTGKTYTIVHMVLRMLSQDMPHGRSGRPDLRQILLVTYTEKAAGELRERIRAGIEKTLRDFPATGDISLRMHLQKNLDNMEEAWIGTIHSICQRILRTYPFESRLPFITEMQDDAQGSQQVLRQVMREDWSADPLFDQALQLLAQEGVSFSEKQLAVIAECAAMLVDPSAMLLESEEENAWRSRMDLLYKSALTQCQERDAQLSDFLAALSAFRNAYRDSGGLNVHAGKNQLTEEQLLGWEERMTRIERALFFHVPEKDLGKARYSGNLALLTAPQKKTAFLAELDRLRECVSNHPYYATADEYQATLSQLRNLLAHCTTPMVAKHWQARKSREGLLSFHDLLAVSRFSVHHSAILRQALRSQFCYALIDEFQDTSPLQWDIFRKLFLGDSEDVPNPASSLFLVGDPKQSIYSFQGANVDTYLEACASVQATGQRYTLQVNYRSTPEIIAACNQVVEGKSWWLHEKLDYPSFLSAQAPARPTLISTDTDAALSEWMSRPLRLVSMQGKTASLRYRWARFIARSIRGLHGRTVCLPDGDKWKNSRPLNYGDFAILAETNKEADRLVKLLNQAGVPTAKYKQEGIFQSEMARQVRVWCEAILYWETDATLLGKVLVTALGNQTPQEVAALVEQGGNADVKHITDLLRYWNSLASDRLWARLLHSLLTDSSVEKTLLQLVDGDRQISDLRQILEYSHAFLDEGGRDLSDLVEHLRDLAEKRLHTGRESNLHQKESDLKAVQVMTMHASKGLQFPVVYLATRKAPVSRTPRVVRWVENASHGSSLRCYPCLEKPQKETVQENGIRKEAEQQEQESQRLYYVAMTRAQILLFIPANEIAGKKGAYKTADRLSEKILEFRNAGQGPICLHPEEMHLPELAQTLSWSVKDNLREMSVSMDNTVIQNAAWMELQALHLPSRSRRQESYTSLTHATAAGARDVDLAQEPLIETIASDEMIPAENTDPLPRGKQIGIAWHGVLEFFLREPDLSILPDLNDPFDRLPDHYRNVITHELRRNGVLLEAARFGQSENSIQEATWRICSQALTIPLQWNDQGQSRSLRLCDLPVATRLPEMEFHLRSQNENLLGFMDLVFRLPVSDRNNTHPYRYFILDWKSNRLEKYTAKSISDSIYENRYDDQARLYCHALDQWLRTRLGNNYIPEMHLGGALYIYLRGLNLQDNCSFLWFHAANPSADGLRVKTMLHELKTRNQGGLS